jgi:uncharacterized membrane protein
MRGLAIVVMVQCHTFHSLARPDTHDGGIYFFSQFVGGMAAPLFLFMAGMTFAFQMESLERRKLDGARRWVASLKRAGYILVVAFLFRLTNWLGGLPHPDAREWTKVDILNCMAAAMAVFSLAALADSARRVRLALVAAVAIAGLAPVISHLPWANPPSVLRQYLVPVVPGGGQFPFFPCASYLGFGLAAGTIVKRAAEENLDRVMQWTVLVGFITLGTAQYFANFPYSIYEKAKFWTESPALILIRVGIMLLALAASYVWTQSAVGAGWSWMQCLGKNSLMVYWVHVMIVYGALADPLKRALGTGQTLLALAVLMALMVAMSAAWLWWKERRRTAAKVVTQTT